MLPDDLDPNARHRSELPALPKEKPSGYRPGWQLGERLQGVGVILLGLVGLGVVYSTYAGMMPAGVPAPPPPPGAMAQVPIVVNAATCLLPFLAIGAVGLLVVGVRQVIDP